MNRGASGWLAVVALALAGVAACSSAGPTDPGAAPTSASSAPPESTSTTVGSPPPTTAAPTTTTTSTTTTTTPSAPVALQRGDEGSSVTALQERLMALGYWLPEADGTFGHLTQQAVLAFQKVEGFTRDGIVGDLTLLALDAASPPTPRHPERDGIEIDLERQVMLVVRGGAVVEILNTSTGRSGWSTRPGDFTIYRQIDGMRHAPLGNMWRPKYFNGGVAMHGSTSIPGYPASHGCARLSYPAIDHLWASGLAPVGTPVTVY